MDKARKKNIWRIIVLVCAACVVALLAAMPLIAKQDDAEDGPKASILSDTVSTGSINTELIGGGTLADDDAVTIALPSAVKLKEFLVTNGDAVTEGTAIATVDRITVMTAIAQVQETLEYLSEQIEEASNTDSEQSVAALAGGIVKILYTAEGDSVQSVMLEHGALAVLSLDGLMAVDLETESTLPVGTAVTVTLSDGTAVSGKITKNLAGEMTVTLEDDSYAVNDPVQVNAEDGTTIGSGELYIYSPWNATAYAGTVKSVKVGVGEKLRAGKTIMVLEDVGYSAAYRQLISQRQKYEELMLELFKMYQTETITAPCDGVVSGIDKNSVPLLANTQEFTISLLVNAPDGNDETVYTNFAAKVVSAMDGQWNLMVNPAPQDVTDYKDLSGVSVQDAEMTQEASLTADIPVYVLVKGDWKQTDARAGDLILIAFDEASTPVWAVRIADGESPVPDATEPPTEEPSAPPTEIPTEPSIPNDPTIPSQPSNPETPANPSNPGFPSGGGSWGDMSGSGMDSGFIPDQEPAFELYGLDMAQIAAVTPQDTMTLEITIDEMDIKALQLGMTAQVKIVALGGEKHTATITEIGNTGANNGGNSKYTVELTMDRAANMLSGMNATATIVLYTVNDVLMIPADALVENGNQTIVYTGYDEETKTLLDPVTVKLGSSDGENVEILEGLAAGQTYYYAYYDTLEISFTPDFGGGGFMFG